MDIVYNLKKFFSEQQDEAAIPGLGVFYKSAVDQNGNELPEGESMILFIEKAPRSNAFVNFLGYEENLTENDAVEVIEKWVSSILSDLKTIKVAVIPELGSFEITKDKVEFIPAPNQYPSYQADYGLDELNELPETSEEPKKREFKLSDNFPKPLVTIGKPMKRSTLVGLIVAAVIVVLIGGGITCYQTIHEFRHFVNECANDFSDGYASMRTKKEPSKIIIPTVEIEKSITIEEDDLFADEPKVEEKPTPTIVKDKQQSSEKPTSTESAKASAHKPFKVIGGAFSIKANAEKFHKQMKQKGYTTELFFENKKQLYFVTLGSFDSMSKALDYKEQIRSSKNISCWVYKK